MTVTVRAFAAAAESLGAEQLSIDAPSVAVLRHMLAGYGDTATAVLARCSLLRDGVRLDDDAALHAGDVVDVLPPFAGG